jgi:hypothetical protein
MFVSGVIIVLKKCHSLLVILSVLRDEKRKPKEMNSRNGSDASDDFELTKAQLCELKRRIADAKDSTRYLIESRIGNTFILYYNLTDDVYVWKDASHATLFKRRKAAVAVQKLLGRGTCVISCTTRHRNEQLVPALSSGKRATKRGKARSTK